MIAISSLPRKNSCLPWAAAIALVALASTALTGSASGAEFPAVIVLSSLDGRTGFRLNGSGILVASAGDVNGDGFDDVIVGAPGAIPHGRNTGSSYVVFGKAVGLPSAIELSSLDGANGFRIDGQHAQDRSGSSVASAGDVNGDGFADVIIGAYGADPQGDNSGSSYVVFGKASGFPSSIALVRLDGTNGFRLDGAEVGDRSGGSVASVGDVNGDGFADVIVGARYADPHGYSSGSSYVVFGKASRFDRVINLSSLNGANGFRLDGVAAGDFSGNSVASAGDVNGDGFADAIIGAPDADPHGGFSGSSYVVFGKAAGFAAAIDLSSLDGTTGFRLDGVAAYDRSGYPVASAGDVNGDGFADVIVGASRADPRGESSGSSYVVFGQASGFAPAIALSTLDGANGFRLDGVDAFDRSGSAVASVGDVNGDGFADAIVGALLTDTQGRSSGSSYIVFGRAPDRARRRIGADADQYISGGPFADPLFGRNGNDEVEGRDGADAMTGGPGRDTASYAHARHGVVANLAMPANNTGEAAGDGYAAIENLTGSPFADRLTGDRFANRLAGGKGADVERGGGGPDVFAYLRLDDSPRGSTARDRIADFDAGTSGTAADRIDLSAIDAREGPGNQAFAFIGTAPFTLGVKGQLRATRLGTSVIVEGEVNGDRVADIQIELTNFSNLAGLTASDFIR